MTQLPAFVSNVFSLSIWLMLLVVIFVPLERLFAAHPQKVFRKGMGVDLGYYFLSGLLPAMLLSAPIGLLAWTARHAVPEGVLAASAALPLWAKAFASLVAGEVGYYWGHRWSHEIPYLWRFHSIHHSAEEIDFLVNSRAHPVDMVFGRFCGLVPMYLLGLGGPTGVEGSVAPAAAVLFSTLWGYFLHANVRWRFGPLEWLVSTPAFHHWHHTATPVNRNYSSTLPWIDRIFGTHYLPRHEWPTRYGIKAKMPETLAEQLIYPLFPEPTDQNIPPVEAPEAAPAPVPPSGRPVFAE